MLFLNIYLNTHHIDRKRRGEVASSSMRKLMSWDRMSWIWVQVDKLQGLARPGSWSLDIACVTLTGTLPRKAFACLTCSNSQEATVKYFEIFWLKKQCSTLLMWSDSSVTMTNITFIYRVSQKKMSVCFLWVLGFCYDKSSLILGDEVYSFP